MWNLWEKKSNLANLDTKNISYNKIVWQAVKPFFTGKTLDSDQFTLTNNDEIISDDENIATFTNKFFLNVVNSLNLKVNKSLLNQNVDLIKYFVMRALKRIKYL